MTSSPLLKLREWLTVDEAAAELSQTLGEDVPPYDVLRLAIDEQLRLSVYLPTKVTARCERLGDPDVDPKQTDRVLQGLCDLPMTGRGKLQMEHDYHWSRERLYVPIDGPVGAIVEQNGMMCKLPPDRGESGFSSRSQSEFPRGSVLCVRRAALDDFTRQHSAIATTPTLVTHEPEKQLGTRERATLLTIIAALAKEAKIDIAQASKAGETISNLIAAMGHDVAPNTIARHLRALAKTLSGARPDDQSSD